MSALKKSIEKWRKLSEGEGAFRDRGMENCALCKKFFEFEAEDECVGCPVSAKAGKARCVGTPYEKWNKLLGPLRPANKLTAEQRLAARDMLDFLKSLEVT